MMPPASLGHAGPASLFQLKGDAFEPLLRSGDYLLVAPSAGYQGEGAYVLRFPDDEEGSPFIAERLVDGSRRIRLSRPNNRYGSYDVSEAAFNEAVEAQAIADVRVRISRSQLERMAA